MCTARAMRWTKGRGMWMTRELKKMRQMSRTKKRRGEGTSCYGVRGILQIDAAMVGIGRFPGRCCCSISPSLSLAAGAVARVYCSCQNSGGTHQPLGLTLVWRRTLCWGGQVRCLSERDLRGSSPLWTEKAWDRPLRRLLPAYSADSHQGWDQSPV